MSTTLLNRRMDLIHTSTNAINTLKMDTSYPVRLSGIVVKVFQAIANYSNIDPDTGSEFSDTTNLFFVQNQEGSSVTTIQKQNVFDFAGKKLKNDEYITGDYVLAIIDINNNKIFIHSLQNATGIGRDDPIYTKDMDYHCNGINDNTVLGGIANILIDLYDYNQNINYDQDEFTYSIINNERQAIFPSDKFTINIIGKFGIDYSDTDFIYEDIDSTLNHSNRQNRSVIMKLSGTDNSRSQNVSKGSEKDLEMIFNWERCYIPKIVYNNETCAAMYNMKLSTKDTNGNAVYYDYWTEENTAHFVDGDGNPYGNLYPRRLIFVSIEGMLPINITFKNFSINTFGTAIYCQTESKKTIKIENSKITINNIGGNDVLQPNISNADIITNSEFYKTLPVPSGCAIDINAFNPIVFINDSEIKNDTSCRNSNLIINSSSNMNINNSLIRDFNDNTGGYKFGYTKACLDAEYFYDFYYETEEVMRSYTVSDIYDMNNPNVIESLILTLMFYNNSNNGDDTIFVMPTDLLPLSPSNIDIRIVDFSTMNSEIFNIDYENRVINYTVFNARSKNKIKNCRTGGALKNIPVMYRDITSANTTTNSAALGLNEIEGITPVRNGGLRGDTHLSYNKETFYMPKLFVNNCNIRCALILFQFNSSTRITNSILYTKLFDPKYNPDPIRILSGDLSIDNCDCSFDTRITNYFIRDGLSILMHLTQLSYIKLYNNIVSKRNVSYAEEKINRSLYSYPSVIPLNSPKLNISNSKFTLYPDIMYNTIPRYCGVSGDAINTEIYNYYHNTGYVSIAQNMGMKLSFIDSGINEINDESTPFFNPMLAPNINIDSSEFNIGDTYSKSEILGMGDHRDTDSTIKETVGIIVRAGSNIVSELVEDNSRYIDTPQSYNHNTDYSLYINKVNTITTVNHKKESEKRVTKFFNINTGIVTTFTELIDDTVVREDSNAYDLTGCTTNYQKLNAMGMMGKNNSFSFYDKLATINHDTAVWYDSDSKQIYWSDPDTGDNIPISSENIENHIFICYLYGSDLAHTGYYIYDTIRSILNRQDNIDPLDIDIESKYNSFGVVAFKLENSVFNMDNCKIGGTNHTGLRNSYNMELFTRRSPKICFNFKSTGIYKVSNTSANAWGSVLWSTLDVDIKKAYDKYKYRLNSNDYRYVAAFDFTSLNNHNYGKLIINNCDFKNYSSLRVKQTSEDWMDYLDSNYNIITPSDPSRKEIYDKGNNSYNITDITNKNELRLQDSVKSQVIINNVSNNNDETSEEGFNESVRNANEVPIIYINNINTIDTQINNTDIRGNETIIVQGNVYFNNCTYINIGNGLICYLGCANQVLPGGVNPKPWYNPPKLFVNNSKIIAIKDIMYNSYIDHDRRKMWSSGGNSLYTFEKNYSNCGMSDYDNVISAFFIESEKSEVGFTGNTFISKPNSFNEIYSIHRDTKVRLIYFNNGSILNFNFKDNTVRMMYDCPAFYNYLNANSIKILPSSDNYAVIDINVPEDENQVINSCINISGNNFDVATILNNTSEYSIIIASTENNGEIRSLPVFYTPENYSVYLEECIIDEVTIDGVKSVTFVAPFNGRTITLESNKGRNNDINLLTVFSDTKLINPFDISSIDHNSNLNTTSSCFDDYIENNGCLYKYELSDDIISDTSRKYKHVEDDEDGNTHYYYNTIRYVINSNRVKGSRSIDDYNFAYSNFKTPILKCNMYITANISNNTFNNSDIPLSPSQEYVSGNNLSISVIHSPSILDIYKNDTDALVNPKFSIYEYEHKKLNINNNIFTDVNPKNILISTLNRSNDWSSNSVIGGDLDGYVFDIFFTIQKYDSNTITRYFKYDNFNNSVASRRMYKNQDNIEYLDTKSYAISINNFKDSNNINNIMIKQDLIDNECDNISGYKVYNTSNYNYNIITNNDVYDIYFTDYLNDFISGKWIRSYEGRSYNYTFSLASLNTAFNEGEYSENERMILSFNGIEHTIAIGETSRNYYEYHCNILPGAVVESDNPSGGSSNAVSFYINPIEWNLSNITLSTSVNAYRYNTMEHVDLTSGTVLTIDLSEVLLHHYISITDPKVMVKATTVNGNNTYYIPLNLLASGSIDIYNNITITPKNFNRAYGYERSANKDRYTDTYRYSLYPFLNRITDGITKTLSIDTDTYEREIKKISNGYLIMLFNNYFKDGDITMSYDADINCKRAGDLTIPDIEFIEDGHYYRSKMTRFLIRLVSRDLKNGIEYTDDEVITDNGYIKKPYIKNTIYDTYLINPIQSTLQRNSASDEIYVYPTNDTNYYSNLVSYNTKLGINTSNNTYIHNGGFYNSFSNENNNIINTLKLKSELSDIYSSITKK